MEIFGLILMTFILCLVYLETSGAISLSIALLPIIVIFVRRLLKGVVIIRNVRSLNESPFSVKEKAKRTLAEPS
jgi:ABC-type phosphate transport system permease subunit